MRLDNRTRMFNVIKILEQQTDCHNPLSCNEIRERLLEKWPDAEINTKSIRADIEIIDTEYFEVGAIVSSHGRKSYYKKDRLFESYQLRILLDAVQSGKFIDFREKKDLIEKIRSTVSRRQATKFQSLVHPAEQIDIGTCNQLWENIDCLHNALQTQRQLAFLYGHYNANKQFTYTNHGNCHKVIPLSLVWKDGFYYLVAIPKDKDDTTNYRVDRMRDVVMLNETFTKKQTANFNLYKHLNESFNMYPGNPRRLEAIFDNNLINKIIDRFGLDANIHAVDNHCFKLVATVAVNHGLVRWLLSCGSQVKVIEPKELVESIKQEIAEMKTQYIDC